MSAHHGGIHFEMSEPYFDIFSMFHLRTAWHTWKLCSLVKYDNKHDCIGMCHNFLVSYITTIFASDSCHKVHKLSMTIWLLLHKKDSSKTELCPGTEIPHIKINYFTFKKSFAVLLQLLWYLLTRLIAKSSQPQSQKWHPKQKGIPHNLISKVCSQMICNS